MDLIFAIDGTPRNAPAIGPLAEASIKAAQHDGEELENETADLSPFESLNRLTWVTARTIRAAQRPRDGH
jgi:hypothetical protein